jgi:DNA invertase Pin-like site-specific DNA recombinase
MKRMNNGKAILYQRLSAKRRKKKDGQAEYVESDSIEIQEKLNRQCAEQLGLEVGWVIHDPGKSARKLPLSKRPGGQVLIDLIKSKQSNRIVTKAIHRLFRDQVDGSTWLRKWHKWGVLVHIADQGGAAMDISTPSGWLAATMQLVVAEYEALETSYRTSQTMLAKQKNGHRMGGNVPFGHMVDPNDPDKIVECKSEQAQITKIVYMNGLGSGLREIATQLNHQGLQSRGTPWHHQKVKNVLSRFNL